MGRRRAAGFTKADAHAGDQQDDEGRDRERTDVNGVGQAAQGGEPAPDRQRDHHDALAAGGVGDTGDRDAHGAIDHREGEAGHHAKLGVIETQVSLDVFLQDVDDLPVDEIEDVDDNQDP